MSKEVCLARAVFGNSVLSFRIGDPAAIASSSVSVPSALALAMRDWRALMNASRRCEYDVDLVGTFGSQFSERIYQQEKTISELTNTDDACRILNYMLDLVVW
jgi:hypothetical protein